MEFLSISVLHGGTATFPFFLVEQCLWFGCHHPFPVHPAFPRLNLILKPDGRRRNSIFSNADAFLINSDFDAIMHRSKRFKIGKLLYYNIDKFLPLLFINRLLCVSIREMQNIVSFWALALSNKKVFNASTN